MGSYTVVNSVRLYVLVTRVVSFVCIAIVSGNITVHEVRTVILFFKD